jgi:hypothetical protein
MRSAALRWAVKSSFVGYVTAVGGTIEASAPASVNDAGYTFPRVAGPGDSGEGRLLKFRGTVTFAAHEGLMRLKIADPWIDLDAEHGQLSVAAGPAAERTAFADLDIPAPFADGSLLCWAEVSARLAESGVAAFDYHYPAGTELSPADFSWPIGSQG